MGPQTYSVGSQVFNLLPWGLGLGVVQSLVGPEPARFFLVKFESEVREIWADYLLPYSENLLETDRYGLTSLDYAQSIQRARARYGDCLGYGRHRIGFRDGDTVLKLPPPSFWI